MVDAVISYLVDHQVDVRKGNGDEWTMNCFRCYDRKCHLYYNARKHKFICFKCGWKGTGYTLVNEFNLQNGLTGKVDLDIPPAPVVTQPEMSLPIREVVSLPVGAYPLTEDGENCHRARLYLQKRGIGMDKIQEYHLHYTHFGRFAGRVIFPIYENGRMVSYVGRTINPKASPKVLNPTKAEANSPSRYLYNYDRARFYPALVLTEGTFDCITTGVVDYRYGAVATFGKKLTQEQIRIIFQSSFKEILFAWDLRDAVPDIVKYAQEFIGFYPVRVVLLPGEKDPNDLGYEEMANLIRHAVPFDRVNLKLKNF